MRLTAEEKRRLKQDELARVDLRKSISWLMLLVGFGMVLYYTLTSESDMTYVLCNGMLAVAAALELCVIYSCSLNPKKYFSVFSGWTVIYGAILLIWAICTNQLDMPQGWGNIAFFLAVTVFSVSIRLFPAISMTMMIICFAVNYYLTVKFNGYSTFDLVNYLCLFVLEVHIVFHLHYNSVSILRGKLKEEAKSRQLADANEKLHITNSYLSKSVCQDALTGAGNRLAFNRTAEDYWNRKLPFTLSFIDLDGLKRCNDTYGHAEGDAYILAVSDLLMRSCGQGEKLFRIGGDEFAILSCSKSEAEQRASLAVLEYGFSNSDVLPYEHSFSFGCVGVDPKGPGQEYSKIITLADRRMYENKMKRMQEWEYSHDGSSVSGVRLNRSGLDSRVFDALATTTKKRYLYLLNIQTNVSRWSANAIEDFDLPGEYMFDAGILWMNLLHPDDREVYQKDIQDVLSGKKERHSLQYRVLNRQGHYVTCSCEGYVLKGMGLSPDYFAGTIDNHGIIDNIDPITGLYNTHELLQRLRRKKEDRELLCLLGVGIRQFHIFNDRYGYALGNQLLEQFGQKISRALNGQAMVYRIDGVKFAISFNTTDRKTLDAAYEMIVQMAERGLSVEGNSISVPVSGGALIMDRMDIDEETVLGELQYAVSSSKYDFRGGLYYYDDKLHSETRKRLQLASIIRQSVVNDFRGFYLVYQPQVTLDGHMLGAEALLRWKNDDGEVVSPGVFIPMLENDPYFYDLSMWVLRTSLQTCKPLLETAPDFSVNVNISYRLFDRASFRQDIMQILTDCEFPAQNLTIELTERTAAMHKDAIYGECEFFRAQGIGIAADDFGVGYSGLEHLRDIPFSSLKVDASFVRKIMDDDRSRILVENMLMLGKKLNVKTCIEGVETRQMLEAVQDYGADYYQGFYFARPTTIEQVRSMLLVQREAEEN